MKQLAAVSKNAFGALRFSVISLMYVVILAYLLTQGIPELYENAKNPNSHTFMMDGRTTQSQIIPNLLSALGFYIMTVTP